MSQPPDATGLVFTKDRLELPDNVEAILGVMRAILAKPFIQKISLEAGGDIEVAWHRDPSDSLLETPKIETAESVLDRIELIESEYEGTAKENLLDSLSEISLAGYVPTHVICGDLSAFKTMLGLPKMFRLPKSSVNDSRMFLGLVVEQTSGIPSDTVIVCGCRVRSEEMSDILFGIRILTED